MNPFGISERSYRLLAETFQKYPEIEEVIVFGSRAKENFKKGSDIDIALKGRKCTPELAFTLKGFLNEELPIPYHVDVVDYNSLEHKDLKEHIDRVGRSFFEKAKA